MNYYIDCEFLEGPQMKRIFGVPYAKTKPTIDLISIGIVCEDGREYYAISKDFNLEEAWNRFDWDPGHGDQRNEPAKKVYWIRDNVLRSIWNENYIDVFECNMPPFCYEEMKTMISKTGKSNSQIAEEIRRLVNTTYPEPYSLHKNSMDQFGRAMDSPGYVSMIKDERENWRRRYAHPVFYGYFADYDWVVFCWLFGKMIELPLGFPMYCRDLKQELDNKVCDIWLSKRSNGSTISFEEQLSIVKSDHRYPWQTNEHNALSDARWNKQLHDFIKEVTTPTIE